MSSSGALAHEARCDGAIARNLAEQGNAMKSTIVKRSVVIRGHKTSVSLEEPFWTGLRDFARLENVAVVAVLQTIDGARAANSNLSSAIRIFLLAHYRDRARAVVAAAAVNGSLRKNGGPTNGDARKAAA